MKTRQGFVSNSSSTSFTCDVCGNEQSGMDMSLRDCSMVKCVNDHTVCRDEMLNYESGKTYDVPAEFCPLCQMKKVCHDDIYGYALRKLGKTRNELEEEIKILFPTYKEFKDYIK